MTAKEKTSNKWFDRILAWQRLFIFNSGVLFILMILIFWVSWKNFDYIREIIRNDFNTQQLVLSRQVAHEVNIVFQDIQTDLKNEGIFHFDLVENRQFLREELQAIFNRLKSKGIIQLRSIPPKGKAIFCDSSGIFEQTISKADLNKYTTYPQKPDFFVREMVSSNRNLSNRIIEVGTLISPSGGNSYFLLVSVQVNDLIRNIAKDIQSGKTGYVWVIDELGRFLFHPKQDYIGKNAFEVREKEMPYISFDEINQIQKEKMLKGEEGVGTYRSGWHRGISKKMDKLIAYTPVRVPGTEWLWSVAVVAPVSEVQSSINRMYLRQTILEGLLIIGIFITGFVAFVYKRRLSNALEKKLQRTERSLHQTEEYYRSIFESALDPIYLLDEETRFISMNMFTAKVLCNMVSAKDDGPLCDFSSPDQFVGMTIREVLLEKEAKFLESKVKTVFGKKRVVSFEHRFWIKDRRIHWNTKYIPIFDEQNKVTSVLGISRDITEKKEMAHLIYNTEKLASLGTLSAGVAHEINNPLGVILGFTDLLLDRAEEGSQEYEDLKIIEENSLNCKRIVENLMSFARVTEGLEDVVELNRSIQTVVQVIKNTLLTNKVELELDVQENLPRVRGDARELQQVFFNLINNAVYSMREEGGTLFITTSVREKNVDIYFKDTGVGIPKQNHNLIFDPFFTTKKVGEGTGLGLSVSYGIMKKYGGTIKFTSKSKNEVKKGEKTGTKFIVSLPIYKLHNGNENEMKTEMDGPISLTKS